MTALKDRLDLMKPAVSALAAAAAAAGYTSCRPDNVHGAVQAAAGVLLLSGGACALNNWQDRLFDSRSERTRLRPLPAGRMSPALALAESLLLAAGGTALLLGLSVYAASAGLLTAALYNSVYTPLKKRTLAALLPGILCGSLPPLIGWLAAGGGAPSSGIVYLAALFAIWQLPHLWLLALSDAQSRPAPSFLDRLEEPLLQRLTVLWAAAFSFATLFMKVFGLVNAPAAALLLAANAVALPLVFLLSSLRPWDRPASRRLFRYLNASALAVTLLAAADPLYR